MSEYPPNKRDNDRAYISQHLPGWFVSFDGWSRRYRAESPHFDVDGVSVEHTSAKEVVFRANALLLSWTPGSGIVDAPTEEAAKVKKELTPDEPTAEVPKPKARQEQCPQCHGWNMRPGRSCLKCADCGYEPGCGQ